ncbi:MAG TPA: DMT family transporter [Solirubrobacteraceae bacterium]|nr:DMT family transporter [Solirubrobacteraceae bacterium]
MSRRSWLIFSAVSVIWGLPYLLIKIADDGGATPATLAWGRIVIGAAILLAWSARLGVLDTLRGSWRWIALYAVAEISIPFPAIAAGEQRIPSSLAAIIVAAAPLIVALLALRFDHEERVGGIRLAGLAIGLGGVVALVGIDAEASSSTLVGSGEVLLAALGYAIGPMVLKRKLAAVDPRAAIGASLALAALLLTPVAALDLPARVPTAGALAAIAVLGALCTAIAFALMAVLVLDVGPSRALVITYVNPLIAVALGVALLGERPGAGAIAGLLLILAGSWLATDGRLPPGPSTALARLRRRRDPATGGA